jgi:hypothetical protein
MHSMKIRAGRALVMLAVSGLLGLGGAVAAMAGAAAPASASTWVVDLSASQTTLPVGQATTLTAGSEFNVEHTPYFIQIFDVTTGTRVGTPCGQGFDCSATVSQNVATTHEFIAYVAQNGISNPPPSAQGSSVPTFVTWTNSPYQLSLSGPATIGFGAITVTATLTSGGAQLGNSPYYIEIFDETTGKLLNPVTGCGSLPTCSVSFQPNQGGDWLVAFVAPATSVFPPNLAGIQASSNLLFIRAPQIQ